MDKLNKEVEKIKKTNDALKVLLQELQDENSYYKNCEFIDKTFDNQLIKLIFIIPYIYIFSFRKIRLFEILLINIFTFLFLYKNISSESLSVIKNLFEKFPFPEENVNGWNVIISETMLPQEKLQQIWSDLSLVIYQYYYILWLR